MTLEERYQAIKAKIPKSVTLIAVSKTKPVSEIERLYRLGQRDFGENYVQELLEKAEQLRVRGMDDIRWHFIGHLQTNKVKLLLDRVFSIHSVDSLKLAEKIDLEVKKQGLKPAKVFLEVNADGEATKSGFRYDELELELPKLEKLSGIEIQGFMIIPSPEGAKTGESFETLKEWASNTKYSELSMGMSDDFEKALEFGSTHVRLGTVIFGARS